MRKHVKCTGETAADCMECNLYNSLHSLHYDPTKCEKVTSISCGIGGDKQFDEDGNEI